jgi:hypothetical protein
MDNVRRGYKHFLRLKHKTAPLFFLRRIGLEGPRQSWLCYPSKKKHHITS